MVAKPTALPYDPRKRVPVTVVESREFARHADGLLAPEELEALKDAIAYDPEAGAVIPGTGGVRKRRWGGAGRGKRGGLRVVYYYHDDRFPLLLFDVYAKGRRADLTADQKRRLAAVVAEIQNIFRGKRR